MTTFRIQELESFGFQWGVCHGDAWTDQLSELANYCKEHGHCNVPTRYSENSKLAKWVSHQRWQYRLQLEGKTDYMTTFRIQALDSLGFEWDRSTASVWEDRLSELADYRKINGHCNVPQRHSENTKLARWVVSQRSYYRSHAEGKGSPLSTLRIQKLESLGFEWICSGPNRKERLNELADYRKIHGNCNVPHNYSENSKLANWVGTQRTQYTLHLEGKKSQMTSFRIQELESLGFEWDRHGTAWEDRLSELADYRKIHGHSNVPHSYIDNFKLAQWVATQRTQYRFYQEGKTSSMSAFRIQALESLGCDWKPSSSRRKGTPAQEPSLDDGTRRDLKKPANSRQGANSELETEPSNIILRVCGYY
jgi:hypothetical protein